MHADIIRSIDRLELYLSRVKADLGRADRAQALADLAELAEISRRLWQRISQTAKDG
jgi:hypothetical protein